ncbi:DUF2207 domain-containing protein [Propionibacteriaceae bacterium G1746]|uniref:DUF2207 domain-containing protein n=1 Tax=Aestuariimicrobium sp. G57 TaxID=3418485 RepID=UPI003C1ECE42
MRRPVLVCLSLLLAIVGFIGGPSPRAAAAGDTVDSWDFQVTVAADGRVHVTETLVYRFGTTSGRHGIIRTLVAREPWDADKDAVYGISGVEVSSPDASAQHSTTMSGTGRNRLFAIRIGSQDRTITSPTATYTIRYTVTGALRSSGGYSEFYWDLLSGEAPSTARVSARVSVPGGAQDVACSSAPAGQNRACTSAALSNQQAVFTQRPRASGEVLTVGVKIAAGAVQHAMPDLEPRATRAEKPGPLAEAPGIGAAVIPIGATALAAGAGALVVRRRGRDLRYEGLPPGVLPAAGTHPRAVPDDKDLEIPVAFSPPKVPVAEAGLLADGQVDVRETTATLVDLAVRGVVEMREGESGELMLRQTGRSGTLAPHEAVLVDTVFAGQPAGSWVELDGEGSLNQAHKALAASVTNQVSNRGWFTEVPRPGRSAGIASTLAAAVFVAFVLFDVSLVRWWPWFAAAIGVVVVRAVVARRLARGQRTPAGRAVTDQVEGFEKYLTTAETDQLVFEEGEDIFSRYLPWAIIFEVADRWVEVCEPLIQSGRLPAPTWAGPGPFDWMLVNSMLDTVATSASPASSDAGYSGTGFGGGSSFGGGDISSGGGGGGGSASSW